MKSLATTCCLREATLSGGTFDVSWGTPVSKSIRLNSVFKKSSGAWGMGDKAVAWLVEGVMNRKLPEVNWLIKRHLRVSQRGPEELEEGRGRSPSAERAAVVCLGGCPLVCSERSGVRGLSAGTGAGRGRGEGLREQRSRFLGCGTADSAESPISGRSFVLPFPCRGGVYNLLKGTFRLSNCNILKSVRNEISTQISIVASVLCVVMHGYM